MASGLLSDNDRLLFAASKSARSLLDHRVEAQAEMPSRAQPIRLATCWNPITGIVGCCAFAASGYSAAPPSSVMNSRRFMFHPVEDHSTLDASSVSGRRGLRPSLTLNGHGLARNPAAQHLPP
jgi:hypothetical protein